MSVRGAQPVDQRVLDRQREQWTRTFQTREDFMGASASEPATGALERFQVAGVRELIELGPGQGRDTLLFANAGLRVTALDYTQEALDQIARKVAATGLAGTVTTVRADVRARLPLVQRFAIAVTYLRRPAGLARGRPGRGGDRAA